MCIWWPIVLIVQKDKDMVNNTSQHVAVRQESAKHNICDTNHSAVLYIPLHNNANSSIGLIQLSLPNKSKRALSSGSMREYIALAASWEDWASDALESSSLSSGEFDSIISTSTSSRFQASLSPWRLGLGMTAWLCCWAPSRERSSTSLSCSMERSASWECSSAWDSK